MKKLMTWLALPAMICALFMMAEAEPMNWNENTGIDEVMAYSGFGDWGRLIFPADEGYYSGSTLKDLRLTWYSNIQPAKTVEIVNYFKEKADAGETVFYDIYTDAEKAADPWKPSSEEVYAAVPDGKKEIHVIPDASHFDMYDLAPFVSEAFEYILPFFGKAL